MRPRDRRFRSVSMLAAGFHLLGQLVTAALLILCAVALTIWDRQTMK